MGREVTERDFRRPEFADANPCDYEFREDGAIVRKDRWETGLRSIANAVGFSSRAGYEVHEVVERVRALVRQMDQLAASANIVDDDGCYDEDKLFNLIVSALALQEKSE